MSPGIGVEPVSLSSLSAKRHSRPGRQLTANTVTHGRLKPLSYLDPLTSTVAIWVQL